MEVASGGGEELIIACIMCKNETYQNFYHKHLRFHHMIQDDWLIQMIANLKGPETNSSTDSHSAEALNSIKEEDVEPANGSLPFGPTKPHDLVHLHNPAPRKPGRPPKIKKVANINGDGVKRTESPESASDGADDDANNPKKVVQSAKPHSVNKGALTIKIKTQNGTMYSEVKERPSLDETPVLESPTGTTESLPVVDPVIPETVSVVGPVGDVSAQAHLDGPALLQDNPARAGVDLLSRAKDRSALKSSSPMRGRPAAKSSSPLRNRSVADSPAAAKSSSPLRNRLAVDSSSSPPAVKSAFPSEDVSSAVTSSPLRVGSVAENSSPLRGNGLSRTRERSTLKTSSPMRGRRGSRGRASVSNSSSPANSLKDVGKPSVGKEAPNDADQNKNAPEALMSAIVRHDKPSVPDPPPNNVESVKDAAEEIVETKKPLNTDLIAEKTEPLVVLAGNGVDLLEENKPIQEVRDIDACKLQAGLDTEGSKLDTYLTSDEMIKVQSMGSVEGTARYRCSGCGLAAKSRDTVAVHVLEKSCTANAIPRIMKQEMRLVLDVVPNIMEHLSEDQLVCVMDPAKFEWTDGDATLPESWKFATRIKNNGEKSFVYLSPHNKIFVSRDQISAHLQSEGVQLAKISGYKAKKVGNECVISCEGRCTSFVVPLGFYSAMDPNRFRKKLQMTFFPDYEIGKEKKIRDKNPRNLERTTYALTSTTYERPENRTERPSVIFYEKNAVKVSNKSLETGTSGAIIKEPVASLNQNKPGRGPSLKRKHLDETTSPHPLKKRMKIRKSTEKKEKNGLDVSTSELKTRPEKATTPAEDRRQPQSSEEPKQKVEHSSRQTKAEPNDMDTEDKLPNRALTQNAREPDEKKKNTPENKNKVSKSATHKEASNGLQNDGGTSSKRNVRGGTDNTALYVQCCNKACKRWRLVQEYKDATEVPDYWVCSMNRDTMNRVCNKGGSHFSGSEVNVKYPRGTLVWGKLKGYPWWPGMIDRSPDCDEYYWVDEKISSKDPARYNVIFFEKDNEVSSAWIKTESIRQDQDKAPSTNIVLSQEVKENLAQAMKIVEEARQFTVDVRLAKFSLSKNSLSSKQAHDPRQSSKGGKPDLAQDATTSKRFGEKKITTPKKVNKPEPKLIETESIKPEQLFSKCNPSWEKVYNKPPLPSDVLITLAVRNLDPQNHSGASFSSIVAFLTLHFPYFNRNIEECKDMVRKAYDINSKEETGRENFRIKNSLIAQLSERINTYINKYRSLVQEAMLINEFLDTLIERFVKGTLDIPAKNVRPPYSLKMLINLTLVSLYPPISLEQIYLFLTFLFPYISEPQDKSAFKREDFLKEMDCDENIEVICNKKGERFYLLREGTYPMVLTQVRNFFSTKSNLVRFNKSIYKPEFINLLLPNLSET